MLQAYYKGTNTKVKTGDVITDFRGKEEIFVNATRKTEIGKSGKVTILNGGEYYDRVFNLEVREYDEYEEKTIFVMDELRELIQAINNRVSNVRYENFWKNGKLEKEIIVIDYINGHQKIINVTCSSLKAIAQEVIKEI